MTELAKTWLAYNLHGEEKDYWSVERLNEMAKHEPEKAWGIIKEINSMEFPESEWEEHINSVIGCGPLEEIIALNSKTLLKPILLEAKGSIKLRAQLSMIYETSVNNEIWSEIQNAIKS